MQCPFSISALGSVYKQIYDAVNQIYQRGARYEIPREISWNNLLRAYKWEKHNYC
jgi:hypothetical protein